MEGVPLKIPQGPSEEFKEGIQVTVPDYLPILQETEYEFSLEKWVLTGLQGGFSSTHKSALPSSGSPPSCPPYWMMFSSPQQSRLVSHQCSDIRQPSPRRRSNSLSPDVYTKKFSSDSEDENESTDRSRTCLSVKACVGEEHPASSCQRGQRKAQRAFVPDLLNPPACLSSLPHQRRKNLRQSSLLVLDTSEQLHPITDSQTGGPSSDRSPANAANGLLSNSNYTTTHKGFNSSGLDLSPELLSAMSTKERELLGIITAQGYPLHTAITALQKRGWQSPEQVLNYLVACDHLCHLGYDMAQVEEALEMFHNCETKAEEFLHLLSQFKEMGFQQNAIKEVLLVHENHRERALEELMMRLA